MKLCLRVIMKKTFYYEKTFYFSSIATSNGRTFRSESAQSLACVELYS